MKIQALDLSVDLLRVLLWQYNDAARLQSLVRSKQAWYDAAQTGFWADWITDVFDLRTANDFGLSVWAVILGMPLFVTQTDDADKPIWGFDQYRENFNNGNFSASSNAALTTEQKRLLLRLRYFQLVTRGAVPEVNEFLRYVFGEGQVYVADSNEMVIAYVFQQGVLTSAVESVLRDFDILPRPAGVRVNLVIQGDADGWGFGRYHENFDNGNFFHA